jgi:hypothetical protein
MTSSVDITNVNAGILSEAAYTAVGTFNESLPNGWQDITQTVAPDLFGGAPNSGYSNATATTAATNEFRVFINSDHQIVIAFKGSNNASNFESDLNLNDQGASAYNSIAAQALTALKNIKAKPRVRPYILHF